jgi:hypothetical protein
LQCVRIPQTNISAITQLVTVEPVHGTRPLTRAHQGIVKIELQPDEKKIANQLWEELKHGVGDAHSKLCEVPDNIRDAILDALVIAIDTRNTTLNPFE